jgi:hypothetical protein
LEPNLNYLSFSPSYESWPLVQLSLARLQTKTRNRNQRTRSFRPYRLPLVLFVSAQSHSNFAQILCELLLAPSLAALLVQGRIYHCQTEKCK